MRKLVIAITALLAVSAVACNANPPVNGPRPRPETQVSAYFLDLGTISKIDCHEHLGSGVRIDSNLVLTAWHVANGTNCMIDGSPVETIYHDAVTDIAVMRTTALSNSRAPISCDGIHSGEIYYGVGWALGRDWVVQIMSGTDGVAPRSAIHAFAPFAGTRVLRGTLLPGQSGGAVFDGHGNIVAFIDGSMTDGRQLALVRSLQDTYLCPHG